MTILINLSSEQRNELLAKARQARIDKSIALQNNDVRTEYMDNEYWVGLYRKYGIRRSNPKTPLTVANMRKYSKKLGKTQLGMEKLLGCTFSRYIEQNPNWSLYATVGIMMELIDG